MIQQLQKFAEYQTNLVDQWHKTETFTSQNNFLDIVAKQHLQNFRLWHQEDLARDPQSTNQQIADVKHKIDQLNQKRNDLIEKIDEYILQWLHQTKNIMNSKAPLMSETFGSIIDRCSIMALKIYHMHEESLRISASQEHQQKAKNRKIILEEQRMDLHQACLFFFKNVIEGKWQFKIYRQFKMYNDPCFNPQIYKNLS